MTTAGACTAAGNNEQGDGDQYGKNAIVGCQDNLLELLDVGDTLLMLEVVVNPMADGRWRMDTGYQPFAICYKPSAIQPLPAYQSEVPAGVL